MKKQVALMFRTHIRSGTLEKTIQYTMSFMRIFFYLNFFVLAILAARQPSLVLSPLETISQQDIQFYIITIIVLSSLFNSLIYQWESWDDPAKISDEQNEVND